ncbi:cytochrome c oxidase subunit 6A2, mitochondrial [Culicoides brevitarsis]|uniref:cytochrome c oxidase subunit 6A2, mitochondrial n=1 Tax=Culicoides brevitarsis TaxID=469753 RepID=UPI00307C56D8
MSSMVLRKFSTSVARRAAADLANAPKAGHGGGSKMWRNMFFFVGIPAVALCFVNCYLDHKNHPHQRPEFIKYEYLRVRTKRFPWGDGNKSLFHNPHVNALPDGYEEEH